MDLFIKSPTVNSLENQQNAKKNNNNSKINSRVNQLMYIPMNKFSNNEPFKYVNNSNKSNLQKKHKLFSHGFIDSSSNKSDNIYIESNSIKDKINFIYHYLLDHKPKEPYLSIIIALKKFEQIQKEDINFNLLNYKNVQSNLDFPNISLNSRNNSVIYQNDLLPQKDNEWKSMKNNLNYSALKSLNLMYPINKNSNELIENNEESKFNLSNDTEHSMSENIKIKDYSNTIISDNIPLENSQIKIQGLLIELKTLFIIKYPNGSNPYMDSNLNNNHPSMIHISNKYITHTEHQYPHLCDINIIYFKNLCNKYQILQLINQSIDSILLPVFYNILYNIDSIIQNKVTDCNNCKDYIIFDFYIAKVFYTLYKFIPPTIIDFLFESVSFMNTIDHNLRTQSSIHSVHEIDLKIISKEYNDLKQKPIKHFDETLHDSSDIYTSINQQESLYFNHILTPQTSDSKTSVNLTTNNSNHLYFQHGVPLQLVNYLLLPIIFDIDISTDHLINILNENAISTFNQTHLNKVDFEIVINLFI